MPGRPKLVGSTGDPISHHQPSGLYRSMVIHLSRCQPQYSAGPAARTNGVNMASNHAKRSRSAATSHARTSASHRLLTELGSSDSKDDTSTSRGGPVKAAANLQSANVLLHLTTSRLQIAALHKLLKALEASPPLPGGNEGRHTCVAWVALHEIRLMAGIMGVCDAYLSRRSTSAATRGIKRGRWPPPQYKALRMATRILKLGRSAQSRGSHAAATPQPGH